jgi:hypothetical protein
VVEPVFIKLLDRFYSRLLKSKLSRLLDGYEIEHIKLRQHDYWAMLFSGALDEQYLKQAKRIAIVHHRHGVSMAEYVGAYGWLSEKLFALIVRHGGGDAHSRHTMLSAMHKLVFLDMMIASQAYEEAVEGRQPPDAYAVQIVELD